MITNDKLLKQFMQADIDKLDILERQSIAWESE